MRPCRRFHSARSLTGLAQAQHRVRHPPQRRSFASTTSRPQNHDPRIRELGREISDDYAAIRDSYQTPKYPIVLAHGLLGFSELQLTPLLPSVQYWHGIRDALAVQGAHVICASVPPSSSIEDRAKKLREDIDAAARTTQDGRVNVIAHSMGGLDARYMISHLPPKYVDIASLVTVASPHRGSSFADMLLQEDDQALVHLPKLYGLIERFGLGTAAFAQLTTSHMTKVFNPATPDSASTRYFSYGASTTEPPLLSPFRHSWHAITKAEGANDGLVAVDSSCWGDYKGTLVGVSHLDLINWSNQVKWMVREWMVMKRTFNAIAFYLDIADMLAKEGL